MLIPQPFEFQARLTSESRMIVFHPLSVLVEYHPALGGVHPSRCLSDGLVCLVFQIYVNWKNWKVWRASPHFLVFFGTWKCYARVAATCIYHLYLICSLFHKELFFLIVAYIYIVCNSLQEAFLYINSFILTVDQWDRAIVIFSFLQQWKLRLREVELWLLDQCCPTEM